MSTTAGGRFERPTATARRASDFGRVIAVSVATWFAVTAPNAIADEFGLYERTGGFVLELDTPRRQDQGTCAMLGIANYAALPDANVRLVARSASLTPAGAKRDYDALRIVAVPKGRVSEALVCFDRIRSLVRTRPDGTPMSVEVAVYRISDQELASGRWSGTGDDSTRLSDWLPIPDGLWRGRQHLADSFRKGKPRVP